MTKHIHRAVLNLFVFTLCKRCGATATHQRECSICGKTFCEVCQEKRLAQIEYGKTSQPEPTNQSASLSVDKKE